MTLIRKRIAPVAAAPAAQPPARKPAPAVAPPAAAQALSEPLHIKYRPATLDDVVGQDAAVANLRSLFEARRVPHTFLLTGPSGTGKTTLARIIGSMVGAQVIEVDAARYSGIESMRELLQLAQYRTLQNEAGIKIYIIDECHALSKATWQTMLKATEEPAPHLYWALCTTEPDKVPNTIKTRAHHYDMRPVGWEVIAQHLDGVAKLENIAISDEFIDLAARQAQGSVRQGLVFLAMLGGIVNREDAMRVLAAAEERDGDHAFELAKMLVYAKNAAWAKAVEHVRAAHEAGVGAEAIRIVVTNVAAGALLKETNADRARMLLAVLQAFSFPYNPSDKMAPVLVAVGSLLLG